MLNYVPSPSGVRISNINKHKEEEEEEKEEKDEAEVTRMVTETSGNASGSKSLLF